MLTKFEGLSTRSHERIRVNLAHGRALQEYLALHQVDQIRIATEKHAVTVERRRGGEHRRVQSTDGGAARVGIAFENAAVIPLADLSSRVRGKICAQTHGLRHA